ncbi:holo-ACP synthase [Peribacillus sp. SCS-37]|uniref:holo-ACP synthase n=1 Tax=Paraperibacillus esterisolvens TaxID=3115296 RepID=UPI003906B8B2
MIKGIGMDLVEMHRMEELLKRQPRLPERILTPNERKQFSKLREKRKIEYLAGRFAAKEAFAKASGTGIGSSLSFLDIEIAKAASGKPVFTSPVSRGVHLSITHTAEYAAAQVVIEEV